MNIEDAKKIALADYLQSLGYFPSKQQGNSLWYNSPFRKETIPSFKVNLSRNEWYDFGLGKGGNIIAFTMELHGMDSVPNALKAIVDRTSHIRLLSLSFRQTSSLPGFEEMKTEQLTHPALIRYLKERKVDLLFAQQYCKEIHFRHGDKWYFAIGFVNDKGGYELRNEYFKSCISPKDITVVRNNQDACHVFEGFMDYLSFLTLRQKNCPELPNLDKQDYIILNSTCNLHKAIDLLETYEHISCFLDNDESGRKTTYEIKQQYGYHVSDQSVHYRGYKDLNDFLVGKKQKQDIVLKTSSQEGGKASDSENTICVLKKKLGRRMKF